jgi:hypothetical protein
MIKTNHSLFRTIAPKMFISLRFLNEGIALFCLVCGLNQSQPVATFLRFFPADLYDK